MLLACLFGTLLPHTCTAPVSPLLKSAWLASALALVLFLLHPCLEPQCLIPAYSIMWFGFPSSCFLAWPWPWTCLNPWYNTLCPRLIPGTLTFGFRSWTSGIVEPQLLNPDIPMSSLYPWQGVYYILEYVVYKNIPYFFYIKIRNKQHH